ncbi:deoxyribose-phosphate aldolase [Myriangium duriaei CBS 260.36]|uniref:deoxyribose-phosphate aldolase n=1 Tax=Myriangium duriaei CBS 260.36 TaxID=1168546 RepID=A0A9P4IWZ4_9PEZI|nr:deoxyribose-phosphate aldolase [Myriangium duriaei CBS 260.36]
MSSSPLTDAQWATKIASAQRAILSSVPTTSSHTIPARDAIAQTIDHTLLKTDATGEQIDTLCAEAQQYGFATVCVREPFTSRAASHLKSSPSNVAVVIGFHTGLDPTAAKAGETQRAIAAGAGELDAVLNRPDLQAGKYSSVYAELATIRELAPPPGVGLKLIFETARLSDEEIVAAAVVAHEARWEWIKTSTGFEGHGATAAHVRLMRRCADWLAEEGKGEWRMKVKASGGIRSLKDAEEMLAAGAERLGCSAGVAIVREARGEGKAEEGVKGGY